MPLFHIVYWGPGLSGKSTNLQYVYARTDPERRTKMESRATETERTMHFDLTPATLAPIDGEAIALRLITNPGAVFYDASRLRLAESADGVVFVADSQRERSEANLESLESLARGLGSRDVPIVLQYNKRDLPNATPVSELDAFLNARARPSFPAIAHTGVGVFDTLKACARDVITRARR